MMVKYAFISRLLLNVGFCVLAIHTRFVMAEVLDLPSDGSNVVGEIRVVIAKSSDTLLDIARKYDLGYNEITTANPRIDPWLPKDGAKVILPTQFVLPDAPRVGMVLNLAQMRIFYYLPKSKNTPARVITHPIGVGRETWRTPLGRTLVVSKQRNPAWYPPASIRKEHALEDDPLPAMVPPGSENPLGDYALYLAKPGYLIHGTNRPWGVGMRVSHGCIRMYPEDIEKLFPHVSVGTRVTIVNQPFNVGKINNQLYLQVFHPDNDDENTYTNTSQPLNQSDVAAKIRDRADVDWGKVSSIIQNMEGIPLLITSPDSSIMDERRSEDSIAE